MQIVVTTHSRMLVDALSDHPSNVVVCEQESELYSWRVSPEVKNSLEAAARAHKTSVAQLLDQIVSQWLDREVAGDDKTQDQLRKAAMQTFGTIRGGDLLRSQQVRQRVCDHLQQRRAG